MTTEKDYLGNPNEIATHSALASALEKGFRDCGIRSTHFSALVLLHRLTKEEGTTDGEWLHLVYRMAVLAIGANAPPNPKNLLRKKNRHDPHPSKAPASSR